MIKRLPPSDYKLCHHVIVTSFEDSARQLGATRENCPGNSAFLTYQKFLKMLDKGIEVYGYYEDRLVGCIALERKSDVTSKFKLLAVLLEYRHRGIGEELIKYLESMVAGKMKLGMIYENKRLLSYYETLGYEIDKMKAYRGNKFTVAYMEKKLEKNI